MMRLLKVEPSYWAKDQVANSPQYNLTIDGKLPHVKTYRTFKDPLGSGTMYVSHPINGNVRWFFHQPFDEHGYGGTHFTGYLEDGSKFDVRGPWSSRAGCVNKYLPFEDHVLDVAVYETNPPGALSRFTCGLATGVTLDWLKRELWRLKGDARVFWWLVQVTDWTEEVTYEPVRIGIMGGGSMMAEQKVTINKGRPERRVILDLPKEW